MSFMYYKSAHNYYEVVFSLFAPTLSGFWIGSNGIWDRNHALRYNANNQLILNWLTMTQEKKFGAFLFALKDR
jgi:hypothetical protein